MDFFVFLKIKLNSIFLDKIFVSEITCPVRFWGAF